jgi:hypothetical protein
MGLAVRAQASLEGRLVLEGGVFEGVAVMGPRQRVSSELDGVDYVVPKGWIPGLALVLVVGHEESLSADDAGVNSDIFGPPIITCEGPLMTHSLSHMECKRTQSIFEVLLSMPKKGSSPPLKSVDVCELSEAPKLSNAALLLILANSNTFVNDSASLFEFNIVIFVDLRLDLANEFW